MSLRIIGVLLLVFALSGCHHKKRLTLSAGVEGTVFERAGELLAQELNAKGWEITLKTGVNYVGAENIELLHAGESDLSFVSNSVVYKQSTQNIRTLLPVYQQVVTLLYREGSEPANLKELLNGKHVAMLREEAGFFFDLFTTYGVDSTQFHQVYFPIVDDFESEILKVIKNEDVETLCVLASLHTGALKRLINDGWKLFSLDDIDLFNRGSTIDGFCIQHPTSYPFIIPKNIFGGKPVSPVYSIGQDMMLVTYTDMEDEIVYDLIEDIMDAKQRLVTQDVFFTHLNDDFLLGSLNYPLHNGVKDYLDRNKPSYFERNAEPIGVILSVMVILFGAFKSIKRIRKERIDKYYSKILLANNIDDLDNIVEKAVKALQGEKLEADHSFEILLKLVDYKKNQLHNAMNTFENNQ